MRWLFLHFYYINISRNKNNVSSKYWQFKINFPWTLLYLLIFFLSLCVEVIFSFATQLCSYSEVNRSTFFNVQKWTFVFILYYVINSARLLILISFQIRDKHYSSWQLLWEQPPQVICFSYISTTFPLTTSGSYFQRNR